MGNYITTTGLSERMTSATYDDLAAGLTGTSKTTFYEHAIDRAESYVDAHCGKLYDTPVPASPFIQDIAYALAEYEVYRRGSGDNIPEKYVNEYNWAIKTLELIRQGEIKPPAYNGVSVSSVSTIGSSIAVTSNTALFTEEAYYPNGSQDNAMSIGWNN